MTPLERTTPGRAHEQAASPIEAAFGGIRAGLDQVDRNLKAWTESPNPLIKEVGRYLFREKGKRLRPALLLLCSKLSGYSGPEDTLLAAVVELIHTASLVHDDIIDNAPTRRGRESVHARWGPNITVLLGDYLYIKSIGLSLRAGDGRIVQILADLSARMIEGELLEYFYSGNPGLTEPQYLDIIDMKTASLFAAACQIGAVLGGASAEEEFLLKDVGRNLGISFQIIDDLLDFTGDARTMGKPILLDLAEGRITLPLIHALGLDGRDAGRLAGLVRRRNPDAAAAREVVNLLKEGGSLDYAYDRACEHSDKAQSLLGFFPGSPSREALRELSRFILDREK
ncbi:MAG: polyprenyl synthetase family protein [Candidatus Aminicenantes bacterium]|nr:polyprenyl synthetase family protein [Candidatus Aminicenantes bacterium]